jgi:hypothetical protein
MLQFADDDKVQTDRGNLRGAMISERKFLSGFKRLAKTDAAAKFRHLMVSQFGDRGALWQCFDRGRQRFGLGYLLRDNEEQPGHFPASSRAAVSILTSEDQRGLLLLSPAQHAKEELFLHTALAVARLFEASAEYSADGFVAAVEAAMDEKKQPPPFPYEKQIGLMGELVVLEKDLFTIFSKGDAISYWQGPFAKAKDFVVPSCCIEVKATKVVEDRFFWVSNDDQFLVQEKRPMFLRVLTFREVAEDGDTVATAVERIRRGLSSHVDGAFVRAVKKAGYDPDKRRRYKTLHRFLRDEDYYFRVDNTFPSLQVGNLKKALGIDFLAKIHYAIGVDSLRKHFRSDRAAYIRTLKLGRSQRE